jgi:hypothetical protein
MPIVRRYRSPDCGNELLADEVNELCQSLILPSVAHLNGAAVST